jgi:quercetin dioxygenase-like cupin family protein
MHSALIFVATAFAIVRALPAIADNIGVTPDEIKWKQNTNLGTSVTLEGDPSSPGPYVVRIMVPPHHSDTPHSHGQAENITVISGQFGFGLGPVFDRSKGRVLTPGSFFHLPANTLHFGWTGDEGAMIQAHGMGPFP